MRFFPPNGNMTTPRAVMSHWMLAELAVGIDGWQELVAMAERVAALQQPMHYDEGDIGMVRAAGAIMAGDSLEDALAHLSAQRSGVAFRRDVDSILTRALEELGVRAESWFEEHLPEVTAAVDSALKAAVRAVTVPAGVRILGQSQEALGRDPEAARAWLQIAAASPQFVAVLDLAVTLAGPGFDRDGRYPGLHLFADYDAAWKRHHMMRALEVWKHGKFLGTLHAEREPWHGYSRTELLTYIVENQLEVRAIDWRSLEREDKQLRERDEEKREREAAAATPEQFVTTIPVYST